MSRLPRLLGAEPRWVVVGRGRDDAAVLDLGGPDLVVLTCDVQLEGRHFERRWMTPGALGRRAASVNLSDLAAMGARPRAALVSLQLPANLEVAWFDALMRGIGERCAAYGAVVVGGNLARAERRIAVDLTLLGMVGRDRFVRRGGARPGDRILVTGTPGESAAGLALLRARRRPALSRRVAAALVARHVDPTPRVRAGAVLAARGATAMIDTSDGLAADLAHLCAASGVGAALEASRLPVSAALATAGRALRHAPIDWVLHGGEDYELVCTAPAARVPALQSALRRLGLPLADVGAIVPRARGLTLHRNGRSLALEPRGYQHFGRRRRS